MRLGFEVEIEDITVSPLTIPGIDIVEDNSLRNGREFVSKILPDANFASILYKYLYENLSGTYSERCGFHFHMDVTNKSKSQLMNFIKRYIMVERTLFRVHSDILRANNNFCNLLVDSTEELNIIRNFNKCDTDPNDYSKYMALNIKTMLSIGTFEFRALKGGITPEEFNLMLDIFKKLWDSNAELPYEDQIDDRDRAEAESIINIINTRPHEEESIDDEYMNHHFRSGEQQQPFTTLTESSIRDYLNSI